MEKLRLLIIIALFISSTVPISSRVQQEQAIKRKNVPAAITKAFELSYPKARIKGFSKETEEGKTFYEIESNEGNIARDVLYSPDGTVVSIEESLPYADLPQLVRDAIGKEFPKAKVLQCERITKGSTTEFEVVLKHNKVKYEVVFESNGTVIKKEKA